MGSGYSPYAFVVVVVAIIPVKSFQFAKGRLSSVLDGGSRRQLSIALAGRVAAASEEAGVVPLVVTSDGDVAEWAVSAGFPTLADPGTGLDAAAATGVEWALQARSSWIVLHSDLPLITPDDVAHLAGPLHDGIPTLAPSMDGGTSGIGGSEPFEFSYGSSSFHRHLRRVPDARIVLRRGLAFDIDSPMDLTTAIASDAGAWLEAAIL